MVNSATPNCLKSNAPSCASALASAENDPLSTMSALMKILRPAFSVRLCEFALPEASMLALTVMSLLASS